MGSILNSLAGLIILALDIWAILHAIKSNAEIGMKVLWILLIVMLPVTGLITVSYSHLDVHKRLLVFSGSIQAQ